MKFALDANPAGHRVRGYEPGRIHIDAQVFTRSLIVMGELLEPEWEPGDIAELEPRHVAALAAHQPEVVILGTGTSQVFPPRRLFLSLIDRGIGYEVMDTAAACRTYNIVSAEGRRVLGALFV